MFFERLSYYLKTVLQGRPNPYRPRWIDPALIKYTTPPTKYTDLNQHDANRDHPHAYFNRGYFREPLRLGTVLDGDWDNGELEFTTLLEYVAMKDAIEGEKKWSESHFAQRSINYIKLGSTAKGYSNPDEYIVSYEKEVHDLINSIKKFGVKSASKNMFGKRALDQISVNVSRNGELLFNNRGVHRLSISKLLGIKKVPVLVVVWHKQWVEKEGFVIKHE